MLGARTHVKTLMSRKFVWPGYHVQCVPCVTNSSLTDGRSNSRAHELCRASGMRSATISTNGWTSIQSPSLRKFTNVKRLANIKDAHHVKRSNHAKFRRFSLFGKDAGVIAPCENL